MSIGWNGARAFKEGEGWAVFWKEEGTSHFRDFLVTFGLAVKPEQAMERVATRLRCDPDFAHKHQGGTFYPVPVHMGISNPRRPSR